MRGNRPIPQGPLPRVPPAISWLPWSSSLPPYPGSNSLECTLYDGTASSMLDESSLFFSPCRVEEWRGGLGRGLFSPVARPFVRGCPTISTMLRFHTPLIEPDGPY